MGRTIGQSKYTAEHREAVIVAVLEQGLTISETMRRAQAGELVLRSGERVPGFKLPQATCSLIARKEREWRELGSTMPLHRQAPADALESLRTRLLRMVDRELGRLERRERPEVEKIIELANAGAKIRRLLPDAPRPVANRPGRAPGDTSPESDSPFVDDLARKLEQEVAA